MTNNRRNQRRRSPPPTMAEMFFRNPALFTYVWITNKVAQNMADKGLPRLDDIIETRRNRKRKGDGQ